MPPVDPERLARLCEKHWVARLELFGSHALGVVEAGSDIDILVTFESGAPVGLAIVALQQDLEALFGRSVDLLTRDSVEQSPNKYFRHFALRKTSTIFERP
ncbi:MAG: nucleotidyltransferase domain-containing protein [Phycisphaeraceae bacterium]|nr:nucleotidyltransferase domain-containing protein [Phycisphaeraceae bacterium]